MYVSAAGIPQPAPRSRQANGYVIGSVSTDASQGSRLAKQTGLSKQ